MTFTQNWFEITAKANFERFLAEFKGKPNLSFLEIGCFEGMATKWLLDNVLTDASSRIDVIDTFEGSEEHKRDGIQLEGMLDRFLENIGNSSKVKVHQGFSQSVLKKMDSQFDFIYVDGSHHADDALQDIILSWPQLKPEGIMIIDDYAWNGFSDNKNACIAIDAFLSCFEGSYELLLKEYQVVIRKLSNSKK